MAELTTRVELRWAIEANEYTGFARTPDLLLGDMVLGSRIDKQFFLDTAWTEIEATLGTTYEVPIGENVPDATRKQLVHLHSMLATSWLLMSISAGQDSDQATYAVWLRNEYDRKMDMILNDRARLDGLRRRIDPDTYDVDTGASTTVPTIYTKDSVSAFDHFDRFAHTGQIHPGTWEPGSGFSPRPLQ